MIRKIAAACSLLLVAACTHVTPINAGPSGEPALLIECKRSISNCYQAANKRCPDGYRTASESQTYGGAALIGTSTGLYGGSAVDRRIIVQCK
jgi:hypothetical protein